MADQQDLSGLARVVEAYFDGLYHADSKILAGVFHSDARYVNAVDDDYMNYSIAEYLKIVDQREPPSSSGQNRSGAIISIEFGAARMAFVKAAMTMLGRDYLDFLTFIFERGRWQIISKVFSYKPVIEDS